MKLIVYRGTNWHLLNFYRFLSSSHESPTRSHSTSDHNHHRDRDERRPNSLICEPCKSSLCSFLFVRPSLDLLSLLMCIIISSNYLYMSTRKAVCASRFVDTLSAVLLLQLHSLHTIGGPQELSIFLPFCCDHSRHGIIVISCFNP